MNNLRQLREKANISQAQLGKLFCVKQNTVSKWESGESQMSNDTLLKLSKFYGVSINYILGDEEKDAQPDSKLSELDKQILQTFRMLSSPDRQRVLAFAEGIRSAREEDPSRPK